MKIYRCDNPQCLKESFYLIHDPMSNKDYCSKCFKLLSPIYAQKWGYIKEKEVTKDEMIMKKIKRFIKMMLFPQREPKPERSYSITVFHRGDIITRLEPSQSGDNSYRGNKVEYLGIKNNNIIFYNPDFYGEARILELPIKGWSLGWGLYKHSLS